MLLGTAASDEGCASLLCETNVLSLLIDLLKTHQEDDEIVLQIAFVFLVSLSHKANVPYIVNKTGMFEQDKKLSNPQNLYLK